MAYAWTRARFILTNRLETRSNVEWMIGIISGLITGTATCAVFYWLGGRDLKREADDLRRLNVLIIRALVQAGMAEVDFDERGNPRGLVYRFDSSGGIKLGGTAEASVQHNPPTSGSVSLGGSATVEVVRSNNQEPPPA